MILCSAVQNILYYYTPINNCLREKLIFNLNLKTQSRNWTKVQYRIIIILHMSENNFHKIDVAHTMKTENVREK